MFHEASTTAKKQMMMMMMMTTFRCQHLPARIDLRIQRVRKFVAFAEWQAGRQAGMHACMHARMHAGRHACLLRGCPVAHHHHHHLRHANADLE
jgi:hypothetical protein